MSFPHYPEKWRFPGWVNPEKMIEYMKKQGKLDYNPPDAVIFIYSPGFEKKIDSKHDILVRAFLGGKLGFFKASGLRIAYLSGFGIGAAAVAAKVEELTAFGVRQFVSLGMAGGISPKLELGELVICEESIRDEGSSHHYLEPSDRAKADPVLINQLEESCRRLGVVFVKGSSWTIDTPYRETQEELRYYRENGILTVEMEASALFAVAKYREVPAAAIFAVSDLLQDEREWEPRFHFKQVKQGMEMGLKIILDSLSQLQS
jgi:uridine phosphorylase